MKLRDKSLILKQLGSLQCNKVLSTLSLSLFNKPVYTSHASSIVDRAA